MNAVPLIDTAEAWRSLPPEIRDRIGAWAIAHTLGSLGCSVPVRIQPDQAFVAADLEGFDALERLVKKGLPTAFDADGLPCRRPDLAALGVRSCRVCGGTDDCGCPEGCHWAEADLRSVCAASATAEDRSEVL